MNFPHGTLSNLVRHYKGECYMRFVEQDLLIGRVEYELVEPGKSHVT